MKKCVLIIVICMMSRSVVAQSEEAQQLLLNVEKLAQFKQILEDLKKGYQIIYKGYTTIKSISEGNFSLHQTFLDALLQVSPVVKKYKRVADIINYQLQIIKRGKEYLKDFRDYGEFTAQEMEYISKVYNNLFSESLKNLDDLLMVITAGQLRMSDDERLQAIDRIYAGIEGQFSFLREFSNSTALLALHRKSERAEIETSKKIGGY